MNIVDKQVAPSAARVACIDLDATIIPWGPLTSLRRPFPGAVEAMKAMKIDGWTIVVLTSRLSRTWWKAEAAARGMDPTVFGREQTTFVKGLLERYGVPYDRITAEKVPAAVYFDDKAIHVSEEYPLARAITDFLGSR